MANQEIAQFRQELGKQRNEIARVLPSHVSVERFERVTLTALQQSPSLLQCDRSSLFKAVMDCAKDGLIPDGREAALVKYKGQAGYLPMVGGLLKLVRQSGEISSITAQVVYESEIENFQYWVDNDGEHLYHQPDIISEDPGAPIAAYAMARTNDGEAIIQPMRVSEIEKVRRSSQSPDRGPWVDWWSEQAKKTALKRLQKRLPKSTDRLDSAIHHDNQEYILTEPDQPAPQQTSKDALAALGQQNGAQQEQEVPATEDSDPDESASETSAQSAGLDVDSLVNDIAQAETEQAVRSLYNEVSGVLAGSDKQRVTKACKKRVNELREAEQFVREEETAEPDPQPEQENPAAGLFQSGGG